MQGSFQRCLPAVAHCGLPVPSESSQSMQVAPDIYYYRQRPAVLACLDRY
jgi:hypothetical protein